METPTWITVQATINAPVAHVWNCWTEPQHIVQWNSASDDWHTPHATNDLRKGGQFTSRMEARDGSMGFDFGGTYDDVQEHRFIAYTMGDGRKVEITFTANGDTTSVTETFAAETVHPAEAQQSGWQSILDNFKRYTENH